MFRSLPSPAYSDLPYVGMYSGYHSDVHPGIKLEFQSAAMRYGHTLVPPAVWRRYVPLVLNDVWLPFIKLKFEIVHVIRLKMLKDCAYKTGVVYVRHPLRNQHKHHAVFKKFCLTFSYVSSTMATSASPTLREEGAGSLIILIT